MNQRDRGGHLPNITPKTKLSINLRKKNFRPRKKYVSHYFDQRATYLSFVKK